MGRVAATGRKKKAYGLSLDLDIIKKLESIAEYGGASRIVNQILRDHLDDYLAGKPSSGGNVTQEEVRKMIREEMAKLNLQPGPVPEPQEATTETESSGAVTSETEKKVMSLLDDFLKMREEK